MCGLNDKEVEKVWVSVQVICFWGVGIDCMFIPPQYQISSQKLRHQRICTGFPWRLPNIANGSRFGVRTLTILPLLGFKLNWAPILAILSCFYGFLLIWVSFLVVEVDFEIFIVFLFNCLTLETQQQELKTLWPLSRPVAQIAYTRPTVILISYFVPVPSVYGLPRDLASRRSYIRCLKALFKEPKTSLSGIISSLKPSAFFLMDTKVLCDYCFGFYHPGSIERHKKTQQYVGDISYS